MTILPSSFGLLSLIFSNVSITCSVFWWLVWWCELKLYSAKSEHWHSSFTGMDDRTCLCTVNAWMVILRSSKWSRPSLIKCFIHSWGWWCMPVIPAFRQTQVEIYEFKASLAPGLQSYTDKTCLKKPKQIKGYFCPNLLKTFSLPHTSQEILHCDVH